MPPKWHPLATRHRGFRWHKEIQFSLPSDRSTTIPLIIGTVIMSSPAVWLTVIQKCCQSSCNIVHCANRTLPFFHQTSRAMLDFSLSQRSGGILSLSQQSGGNILPSQKSCALLILHKQNCVLVSESNALHYKLQKTSQGHHCSCQCWFLHHSDPEQKSYTGVYPLFCHHWHAHETWQDIVNDSFQSSFN